MKSYREILSAFRVYSHLVVLLRLKLIERKYINLMKQYPRLSTILFNRHTCKYRT